MTQSSRSAATADPVALFKEWLDEAVASKQLAEPTAMALATIQPGGAPSVRMVLLKAVDDRGFVFYTNLGSPKAVDLERTKRASLCFYWQGFGRQVRVDGLVERVSDEEADAYFATRPRLSQLGAWASRQSQPMEGSFELEREVLKVGARFALKPVPRPPFWSGYRVVPETIELWQEKPFRRHERRRFLRGEDGWACQWLFP
jgi:pyridoxamine 5'-phosphate oxidase